MKVNFAGIDLQERPVLVLKNATGTPIGSLGAATNLSLDVKYNETSMITFNYPAYIDLDGEIRETPYYDKVIGMRIVDLKGVGQFMLINPETTNDGVKEEKVCKGYSLEFEFTFKNIALSNATYNFWNPVTPESSLLGIIKDIMPSWGIGHVDSSLVGKYRTFEVSDSNLYNFIKGTVQNSYNCIFDFDTYNKRINVKDLSSKVVENPIYISTSNLAKNIKVVENTENIVTRLNVNGAEGIDIRDVNPSGTNNIINLDYFMNTDNFEQRLIDKYYTWKEVYKEYQKPYYNLSVEYALQIMNKTTEEAAMKELEGERTILENEQAVIIQSIAKGLMTQDDLNDVNDRISKKQDEINAKNAEIKVIEAGAKEVLGELAKINSQVRFEKYFTKEEYMQFDKYLKDDSLSEASFVAEETASYSDEDVSHKIVSGDTYTIRNAKVMDIPNKHNKKIYDIKGGTITIEKIASDIVSAALEVKEDKSFVMTAYLGAGTLESNKFDSACISLSGVLQAVTDDLKPDAELPDILVGSQLNIVAESGHIYFTFNTSEYQRRSVGWDLYEYGNEVLIRVSQPSYTFAVDSSNFLSLEDFVSFKRTLTLGERIYIGVGNEQTLVPICTGVHVDYGSINQLSLQFSDTYVSSDSAFVMVDLLQQSVSMGRDAELNKFNYSAFVDSGASTKVRDFMTTALDVSKNAIMSSKNQAISWGESGIRLRKWTDESQTDYEDQQVWLNNNSILMTGNSWGTAELAIGNFNDPNLGDCWGIVAPNIVGTLLAGNNLVIESNKKDGGKSVFRVDGEGCVLHNSSFDIISRNNKTQISLNPEVGIALGNYPLYTDVEVKAVQNAQTKQTINEDNAKFWVDFDGNLHFKGDLAAATGTFTGKVTALEGYIGQPSQGWKINNDSISNGKSTFADTALGVYLGVDGLALGDNKNQILAGKDGMFVANNAKITGHVEATSGVIGGCSIENNKLKVDFANITNVEISNAQITSLSASKISGGTLDCNQITVKNLSASAINAGTLDCKGITVINLEASSITAGKITADQIEDLSAKKITEDTFSPDRIPNLSAAKITAGTMSANRISGGTLDFTNITCIGLSADRIFGTTQGFVNMGDVMTSNLISTVGVQTQSLTVEDDVAIKGPIKIGGSVTINGTSGLDTSVHFGGGLYLKFTNGILTRVTGTQPTALSEDPGTPSVMSQGAAAADIKADKSAQNITEQKEKSSSDETITDKQGL